MARYALERIPGQAADKALLGAIGKATGKAKIGIVNSLGERARKVDVIVHDASSAAPQPRTARGFASPDWWISCTAEVAKLAGSSDRALSAAAISALGKIGNPEALAAIDKVRDSVPDSQKMLVYDAYLKIADTMVAKGDKAGAQKIYVSLNREGVPQLVRTAAMKGMVRSTQSGGR